MSKHETRNTLLNNLRCKCSLVKIFSQFMQYYKITFLSKHSMKSVAWKLVKESSVKKIPWRSGC